MRENETGRVTFAEWRAQVDKELAGASFDKTLVYRTAEGLAVQPLYTELPPGGAVRASGETAPFRICPRVPSGTAAAIAATLDEEVEGGADAVWAPLRTAGDVDGLLERARARAFGRATFLVLDAEPARPGAEDHEPAFAQFLQRFAAAPGESAAVPFALTDDPLACLARGQLAAPSLTVALQALGANAKYAHERRLPGTAVMVSTLPYHAAGADAADEIAIALSTGVAYLNALTEAGLSSDAAAHQIALQITVGRETFAEVCKVRALRLAWRKVLAASGALDGRTVIHAVCASRTLTRRDPWVNMLRVTTQVFAAVLGGADIVTPTPFDDALGAPSPLGRRLARNTGLVLREESALGRVTDPAGGSYYFETLTDALAREAWKRFQALEREGGMVGGLVSGQLQARLDAAWRARLELLAKRKAPMLGLSEFANLNEVLPRAEAVHVTQSNLGLPIHRDAEAFEHLRDRAEALATPPEALLVPLGPLAESRARVGFAAGFFGAGGIRTRELGAPGAPAPPARATLACLCGSDERYASEAASRARALKDAGCKRVLVAGRPGALEPALREAGVDGFIFVGSDVVATLTALLDEFQ